MAMPDRIDLPGGHDLCIHRVLRAFHLFYLHSGGPDCTRGRYPQNARHGGADAAIDCEIHLVNLVKYQYFRSQRILLNF